MTKENKERGWENSINDIVAEIGNWTGKKGDESYKKVTSAYGKLLERIRSIEDAKEREVEKATWRKAGQMMQGLKQEQDKEFPEVTTAINGVCDIASEMFTKLANEKAEN